MDKRSIAERIFNHIIDHLKIYWMVGTMAAIHAYFTLRSPDPKKVAQGEFFTRNEYKGRIASRDSRKGLTLIRIEGDTVAYEFLAIRNDVEPERFNSFVRVGDSIYKAPYADYIHVIRDGKRYSWRMAR